MIQKWLCLKNKITQYLILLNDNKPFERVQCDHMGGRKYNYDFTIIFYGGDNNNKTTNNVEFKYNTISVNETPQFVSPMKPSQYMSNPYEDYFYMNYLPILATFSGFEIPEKNTYLSQIHSTNPKCMKKYQYLYYSGCSTSSRFLNDERSIQFYELCKKISAESISSFISNTELNSELLSIYLHNTQQNKKYMLFRPTPMVINFEQINMDDFVIITVVKNPSKYRFECLTKSGKMLKILLRWKNGNGIAFPSFQIS
jgi:hypothetical protein